MNILVTGIGSTTARAVARRVRELYPTAKIIGTELQARSIGFHLPGLLDHGYVVPRSSEDNYWDITHDIIKRHNIDLAFLQPEKEVIAWGDFHDTYGEYPCPVLIPSAKLAKALIDKANMADVLYGTDFIPKTIRMSPANPRYDDIRNMIGYPCWIRATQGSGGYGSLRLTQQSDLEAWLLIHKHIPEFTVSEFLPGRHMANQMMYVDGVCIKNGGLQCVEYVMANVAPSKVTGNTSFGRFVNEPDLLDFCESCIDYISQKLDLKPHGILSFDLKEDAFGNHKVTEVNIRHMAYTGTMGRAGFDMVGDTIKYLTQGLDSVSDRGHYTYKQNYIFLRDVDVDPLLLTEEDVQGLPR